jgi:hypothetical protein
VNIDSPTPEVLASFGEGMRELGFTERECVRALSMCRQDVGLAAALLMDSNDEGAGNGVGSGVGEKESGAGRGGGGGVGGGGSEDESDNEESGKKKGARWKINIFGKERKAL